MRENRRNYPNHSSRAVQFESPSHMGTLLSGLNTLRSKGLLLDITLIAGGQSFQAHRVVLASCSEYFRAMFTDAMKESQQSEICLNGVTAEGMRYLLEYAYTSKLGLSLANIQDVLSAANHVQLIAVVEACSSYLKEQLDLDNCVDVATIAEIYSLHKLLKEVYLFICGNLKKFAEKSEFLRVSPFQLEYILKCDFPVDCSEREVLSIVLKWIEHQPHERFKYIHQLLRYIHFNEISSVDIRSFFESPVLKCLCSTSSLWSRLWHVSGHSMWQEQRGMSLINSRGMELAILKVGGFGISGVTNDIAYYLSSIGKWRYLTSIPHVEQCNFGTAVLNNELYIVGGCFNQSLQENVHPFGFRYNPLTNSWSTMAPMQKERCRFSLGVVNNHLLAVGGVGESGDFDVLDDSAPCEKYDPTTDVWTPVSSLPGSRAQHAGTSWRNFFYVSGGLDQDLVLNSLWRLNTETDHWEIRAPMITPRADHSMVCCGDKIYVCGGWYEDETTGSRVLVDSIDCYSVTRDAWTVITRVPTPRYHAGIVIIGKWLYIVGGFHSATTFDRASGVVECYNMETGIWTVGDNYPQDIWEHACCTLYVPRCRDDLEVIPDKNLI
ncbi:kelch-like protein 26 [Trichonephila inaurata madagascariensis]|uniref:Kelch-like protein diablo n=1 Tax=Trichonephila inaurata madagascariensis TaxID=2747483 RepID=A0A8X6KLP9_9ARAC|nr:kelch-like protein 26 [Trichonephila inaurata madagascariensis]